MPRHSSPPLSGLPLLLLAPLSLGCGGGVEESTVAGSASSLEEPAESTPRREFQPLSLGGGSSSSKSTPAPRYTTEDVRKALNPLQVMVGSWNGTLQRAANFDSLSWAWDFSDRKQPALVFETEKGLVLKSGRLTYFPDDQSFRLTAIDDEDRERTLEGKFTKQPAKEPGDDNRLHMTFKLQLTESSPPEGDKAWQIVLNQRDNNRLLVELEELRGEMFARFETMGVQRDGTSFAKSFDDYGDRTCIVSQGLGTSTVAHMGKTYYVCCSGCRAAFEDDPEYWIAKALEREKSSD